MEPLNEHDELKRSAPTLAGLPKTDPFVVPEPFFEQFPHQVQAMVAAKGSSRLSAGQAGSWAVRWRLAIALPVVALLALGTWRMLRTDPVVDTPIMAMTPLTDEELAAYTDIDPLSLVEEEDLPQLGEVDLDLNDEDLLAYLEEEHADLTELITETE
jgi:hypothetical protein